MAKVTSSGIWAGLALAWAAVVPAQAAPPAAPAQAYVVIVGVGQFADEQIRPRPHAEADAKALYDVLTDKGHLGVDGKHVRLLLGTADSKRQSEPATHENVVKELRWAAANAGRDDLLVFAYFGQGAPLGERFCYFTSDSTFKDRAKNAVAAGDIEHALEKLKSRRFCAFIDVNFKGFVPPKDKVPDTDTASLYREYFAKDERAPLAGRVLFFATGALKPPMDLAHHSLFAKVLLDGLKGKADRDGYEPDGVVTADELAEYVGKLTHELALRHGKTKEEKEQRATVLGSRAGHFVLTRNPAVAAKVQERLEKFNRLVEDGKVPAALAEEGRTLLTRMPKLEAQRALRKKYQELADGTLTADEFTTARAKIMDDTKMKRAVAAAFAAKVIQATQIITKQYVKQTKQGELVASAIKGIYQRIDEKIPPDIRQRLDKAKDLGEEDLTNLLTDVRERLGNREDLDSHKDLDYALQRMMSPLDPYTTYIDPDTVPQFKAETGGDFPGIGVQIRIDPTRDMLMVVTPIKDSPAYKAGIKAGDVITQITREVDSTGKPLAKPEVLSTKGMRIDEAVKKIKGMAGTKVKVTVSREGVDKPLEFELKRRRVEVESVLGVRRKADDSWDYVVDPDYQIAYVRLTQFSRNTARDLEHVIRKLEKAPGIKGFVLDLRFNPGGLLQSAVEISDMFIDDGLIVTIRPRVGRPDVYTGNHEDSRLDFPMVCLVNGHSASGSEIVSACLQDHHRAVIMGERSYGKGSVQNIQPFEEGEIKMTTASFWRPSGKNLNKASTSGRDSDEWGVSPDRGYAVKMSVKERDELEDYLHKVEIIPRRDAPTKEPTPEFKDRQLEKALGYLRDQIKLAARAPVRKAG